MGNVGRLFQLPVFRAATFLAVTSGCAGPTTPLGAIHALDGRPLVEDAEGEGFAATASGSALLPNPLAAPRPAPTSERVDERPSLRFDPPRQVLHGPHSLQVVVDDPRGVREGYDLRVRYHGHDVTQSFLKQARVSRPEAGRRLLLEVPSVRLEPGREHQIEVGYRNPTGEEAVSRYWGPVCHAFRSTGVHGLDEFRLDPALLSSIEWISRQTGFNPAFTAALIAQESSFNPRSVSTSRALGLTQVTPLAEEEIAQRIAAKSGWPRYPGINEMSAARLKLLVMSGKANAGNEWRLHPEHSIRGGLEFAQLLADRWREPEKLAKVVVPGETQHGRRPAELVEAAAIEASDREVARTRLILASYNSGYARVSAAVNRLGPRWLTAPELKEARRYVNRIFSYCDSFGNFGGDLGGGTP